MGKCAVSWCCRPRLARGYCSTHYARMRRTGDPLNGETEETKNKGTKWTEEEKNEVLNFIKGLNGEPYSLNDLAKRVGRPRASVGGFISKSGLGDYKRKGAGRYRNKNGKAVKPPRFLGDAMALRAHQSAVKKNSLAENGHPRGMAGKKHSEATKKVISETSKSQWENKTKEQIITQGEKAVATKIAKYGTAAPAFKGGENMYTRAKGGRRQDLGDMYFRSRWEANYARYLNFLVKHKEISRWEYEPDTYWFDKIKRGVRSYTPDFKVFSKEGRFEYHEVKGWMDDKSKTKLKRMLKYYPEHKIIIIGPKEYYSIAKIKRMIDNWEECGRC